MANKNSSTASDIELIKQVISKYGMRTVWIILLVVIAAMIPVLHSKNAKSKRSNARTALASAQSSDNLRSIVEQYPDSPYAPQALIRLADMYYKNDQFEEASKSYQEFISSYADNELVQNAKIGQIHCIEAMGNYKAAAKAFSDFASANPDDIHYPIAVYGHARSLAEQGLHEDAKVVCDDFLALNTETYWARLVEDLAENIQKRIDDGDKSPMLPRSFEVPPAPMLTAPGEELFGPRLTAPETDLSNMALPAPETAPAPEAPAAE